MIDTLQSLLGTEKVTENVDLFPYLSMRLHAKAQYFYVAEQKDDLIAAVRAAHELQIRFIMLGGGSNMVFGQTLVPGLVVLNKYQEITPVASSSTTQDVRIGSGTPMALVVAKTTEQGLSGFEYHKGLPGTMGGAVYMNSKWTKPMSYVGDTLVCAELIGNHGMVKTVERPYFAFAYDYSMLQKTKELVLNATFRLTKQSVVEVQHRAEEAFAYRKQTQPFGVATCGCFFRNISKKEQETHHLATKSAGYLIDQCGLKGFSIGDFSVSPVHANFIVNAKGTTARPEDLKKLATIIKHKVYKKFGIELHEEVEVM